MHWLLHFIGADNLSGPEYGFWSGFGSDISEILILGAIIGMWRRHNCHVKGCWRLGRHPVEGTPYVTCGKHLPGGPITHGRVIAAHRAHRERHLTVPAARRSPPDRQRAARVAEKLRRAMDGEDR